MLSTNEMEALESGNEYCLELAKYLDKRHPTDGFYMGTWFSAYKNMPMEALFSQLRDDPDCGTSACIAGFCAVAFPDRIKPFGNSKESCNVILDNSDEPTHVSVAAGIVLCLSGAEQDAVFGGLKIKTTQEAAKALRAIVAERRRVGGHLNLRNAHAVVRAALKAQP